MRRNSLFVIFLLGIAAYGNSIFNNFVWDDILLIVNNDLVKGLRLAAEIFSKPLFYLANTDCPYYRPLQNLSYALDFYVAGLSPAWYHAVNILLHITAALLLYLLVRIFTKDEALPFLTALLFVIHPLHASVVRYVAGRADILLAVFLLLSLTSFIRAKTQCHYAFSFACFLAGLLSKEAALVFPICLVLVNEIYRDAEVEKPLRSRIDRRWYLFFFIACILYGFLRMAVVKSGAQALSYAGVHPLSFFITFIKVTLTYIRLVFLPFEFHIYRTVAIAVPTVTGVLVSFLALTAVVFLLFKAKASDKTLLLSLVWVLIWMIPITFVMFSFPEFYLQKRAAAAENWFYIPSIGLFILAAVFLKKLNHRAGRRVYRATLLFIISYLSLLTIAGNTRWRNNQALFSGTLRYVDYSPTLYRNMGWIYLNQKKSSESIGMYHRALESENENRHKAVILKDIAYAYLMQDNAAGAVENLQKALNLNYNYADAHAYLGLAYARSNPADAQKEWDIALHIDPFNPVSFNAFLARSRQDVAVRDYLLRVYTELAGKNQGFGSYRVYRGLGLIKLYAGTHHEALADLEKACRINPYNVVTVNALAAAFAELNDYPRALRLFKKALKLNPFNRETYGYLAQLYRELGEIERADNLIKKSESVNLFR